MTDQRASGWRRPATIRVRLGLALAIALLPVLILSAVQAALDFEHQASAERASLAAAAQQNVAAAQANLNSTVVLLEALGPSAAGPSCARRLAEDARQVPSYENLIRFDASGQVSCAAFNAPPDPARAGRHWFSSLAHGAAAAFSSDPGVAYAKAPAVLAAAPVRDSAGRFDGAMVAVMDLASLRPEASDPSLPGAETAVVDDQGRYVTETNPARFPAALKIPPARSGSAPPLWRQKDRGGQTRLFAAAPLADEGVFAVISVREPGLLSWAWLNPVSALALPILAFSLALIAVLFVAERGVVRWIAYLQRIAAIYARGRLSVRPLRAEKAPPEIRDLAEALDQMARVIVTRDADLLEHLAQKDAMMREIHHRVKNNLQVISSLLNMQQRALVDPAARAAISDTRQRITALALVYRAFYRSSDLRQVDVHDFLQELMGQLVSADGVENAPPYTELTCEPLEIDPDRLAPLALFAVEAISNARKHGLGPDGRLSVDFEVTGGQARLAIRDTGISDRAARVGPGVGRTLMTAFARQLRGEAHFRANPGGGMTASLSFPLPPAEPDEAPTVQAPAASVAG